MARALLVTVALVAVATAVGLVALWPRGEAPDTGADLSGLEYVDATVVGLRRGVCPTFEFAAPSPCDVVSARIESGSTTGQTIELYVADIDFQVPQLEAGDRVVLQLNPLAPPEFRYTFFEFRREAPLLLLAAVFVVAVVALGRWQGVRALAGLVITGGILLWFLVPSLLRDNHAIGVALVAAALVAFATLYLAHGVSFDTTVALVGSLAALALITALGTVFVSLANLTGLSGTDVQLLRVSAEALDPAGLLVAGIVIGALGVLDDVTVTQVAAVSELRAVSPTIPSAELYRRALRVGREHIAATVNTLVLAYAGASLALLVFFVQSEQPILRTLGREVVAVEIVRTLVGSIGLVAAVPITTGLAVLVRRPIAPPPLHTSADPVEPTGADGGSEPTSAPSRTADPPSWDDFAPSDERDW